MERFEAIYFKRNGEYRGFFMEFMDTMVRGRTLAEVKAKLRAALPEAVERARRDRIQGEEFVKETIVLDTDSR